MKPSTEIAVGMWAHDEVQMIGHQAPSEHVDGDPVLRQPKEVLEALEVRRFMKDGCSRVATRYNVRADPAERRTTLSWHAILSEGGAEPRGV